MVWVEDADVDNRPIAQCVDATKRYISPQPVSRPALCVSRALRDYPGLALDVKGRRA